MGEGTQSKRILPFRRPCGGLARLGPEKGIVLSNEETAGRSEIRAVRSSGWADIGSRNGRHGGWLAIILRVFHGQIVESRHDSLHGALPDTTPKDQWSCVRCVAVEHDVCR